MSESKHTSGPWEWVPDRFRGGYSGLVGPDGAEVLFPNHANDGDEGAAWFEDFPTAADARLIAAAPDLLAACKTLVGDIDALISNSDGVGGLHLNGQLAEWSEITCGGRYEEWLMSLEQARDAIGLAEQEQ